MDKQIIAKKINDRFPGAQVSVSENEDLLTVDFASNDTAAVASFLKDTLGFDYLQFVTAIDKAATLELQYHLFSYAQKAKIVAKTAVARSKGKLASVSSVWKTAGWHEREVYDLFGVTFEGHRDLRRIFLGDDFEGHPLLKDFAGKNVERLK